MEKFKRKMKWEEIVLILFALWVVISFVHSLLYRDGPRRHTGCTSNLRQLAMAVTMYSQDNKNRLPGLYRSDEDGNKLYNYVGWAGVIRPYVKDDTEEAQAVMFHCPDIDKKMKKYVGYGYNAALLQPNGMGIEKKRIIEPDKLGVLCDSEPLVTTAPLEGGIIGSFKGSMAPQLTVKPVGRHEGAVVIGYADGHASVVPNYNEKDPNDGVIRAFYRAEELGYINNKVKGKK